MFQYFFQIGLINEKWKHPQIRGILTYKKIENPTSFRKRASHCLVFFIDFPLPCGQMAMYKLVKFNMFVKIFNVIKRAKLILYETGFQKLLSRKVLLTKRHILLNLEVVQEMQFLPILTFNGQAVGDVPLLGEGSAGDVHQNKVKQVSKQFTLNIRNRTQAVNTHNQIKKLVSHTFCCTGSRKQNSHS